MHIIALHMTAEFGMVLINGGYFHPCSVILRYTNELAGPITMVYIWGLKNQIGAKSLKKTCKSIYRPRIVIIDADTTVY